MSHSSAFDKEVRLTTRLTRCTDGLSIAYLLAVALLLVLFRGQVPHWLALFCLHLVGAAFFLWLPSVAIQGRSFWQFLHDWYPVALFPLLFREVGLLAATLGNWGLTERIRSLEVVLFHGHPSLYLSQQWAWVTLSEYLHFCYFFFMIMMPVVGGYWYLTGHKLAFRELIFLLCVTFYSSYFFFILFPVESPFYLSDPPGDPISGHFFYSLVHAIASQAGARGGAFPSTHVSGSIVLLLLAWKRQRPMGYLLLPIIGGAVVATVYGRFHYALDAVGGLVVGFVVIFAYRVLESGSFPGRHFQVKPLKL